MPSLQIAKLPREQLWGLGIWNFGGAEEDRTPDLMTASPVRDFLPEYGRVRLSVVEWDFLAISSTRVCSLRLSSVLFGRVGTPKAHRNHNIIR